MSKEQHIIESWQANADSWIQIIESNGIESRKLVTNKAIVETVLAAKPGSVLDIGCGEGWLVKELSDKGIAVSGVDVIPALIEKTRQRVTGDFYIASYEDMASDKIVFSNKFDAIVINFALIGKESTENLLACLSRYLAPAGQLFIQTLHPYSRRSMNDYVSGWKTGSWDGLGDQFVLPYQWYFRTLEDWLQLLDSAGFRKIHITETTHPQSGQLLSVIFTCKLGH